MSKRACLIKSLDKKPEIMLGPGLEPVTSQWFSWSLSARLLVKPLAYQILDYARNAHFQLMEWTNRMSGDYTPNWTVADMSMNPFLHAQ